MTDSRRSEMTRRSTLDFDRWSPPWCRRGCRGAKPSSIIQDRAPAQPTYWVVLPCVTVNRHERDTEIVCGVYTVDGREGERVVTYSGLGDDPTGYQIARVDGRFSVTDGQSGCHTPRPSAPSDGRDRSPTSTEHTTTPPRWTTRAGQTGSTAERARGPSACPGATQDRPTDLRKGCTGRDRRVRLRARSRRDPPRLYDPYPHRPPEG